MKFSQKLYVTPFLFLVFLFLSSSNIKSGQVPPTDVDLSDKVYADLALRNDLSHVSVYYFDDNLQNTISINSKKGWVPASTVKLFVAMYAFDQATVGNISLDQIVTIQDKNIAPSQSFPNGYGPLQVGDTASVYELLDRMITQSGNVSYNTLLDLLDRTKITKYIHDLGLVDSSIGGKLNLNDLQENLDSQTPGYGINITTADDYARAFILINGKRIPGASGLFDMLSRQKFNSMLPALLPKDVLVAHKTGELDPYYHDGGIIVDKDRRYVLSVFSDTGEPDLVAHISQLIYTGDINLIGNNISSQNVSENENLPPLDPLVASGKVEENVLGQATSIQNALSSSITASDLGIKTKDLVNILSSKELPRVIIAPSSPLHFLIDSENKIAQIIPVPGIRASLEVENLKLKISEAKSEIEKGNITTADNILKDVDTSLVNLAQEKVVSNNLTLQSSINKISQTRFSLLASELPKLPATDKITAIKEIAKQARNTVEEIAPHIQEVARQEDLSQKPVIGKVVSSSFNSITVQTSDGKETSVPIDTQIKARNINDPNTQTQNISQIPNGSVIALAGIDPASKKPSFILTNISSNSPQLEPTKVIKVDPSGSTIIITNDKGIPVQVDLNKSTIIKGSDTDISLKDIKKGDNIIVQGKPIPAETPSSSPSPTSSNPSTSKPTPPTPQPTSISVSKSTSSPSAPATTTIAIPQPQVIKGSVIKVINRSEEKKSPPAPSPSTPAPSQPAKKEKEQNKPEPTPQNKK